MPSDLPPNNPDRIIRELCAQLDSADVREFLRLYGHGQVDIAFRVSRRSVTHGPVFTFQRKAKLPG